jgi:hypothetical protein
MQLYFPAESLTEGEADHDDDASCDADPNRRLHPHASHPEASLPRARQAFDGGASLADGTATTSMWPDTLPCPASSLGLCRMSRQPQSK